MKPSKPITQSVNLFLISPFFNFCQNQTHLVNRSALQVPAMSPILKLDVLLAKMQRGSAFRSRKPKRLRLISRFSTMASTTRSDDETAWPLPEKARSAYERNEGRGMISLRIGTHASVAVLIFPNTSLVHPAPSPSPSCPETAANFFLATLANDFWIIWRPF